MSKLEVDAITFNDLNNFIQEVFQGQSCSLCGSTEQPAAIGQDDKVVFSSLEATDAWGEINIGSSPTIPLMCQKCGKFTLISPTPLLAKLNGIKNEQ